VAESIRLYPNSRTGQLVPHVHARYERLLSHFRDFCAARGVTFTRELGVDVCEQFKADSRDPRSLYSRMKKKGSREVELSRLTGFLRTSFKRGWISTDIAARIEPCAGEEAESTEPMSDEEVDLMLAAAEIKHPTHVSVGIGYASYPHTFRLLLELMISTGLRISDAIAYNPAVVVPATRPDGSRSNKYFQYRFQPKKQRLMKRKKFLEVFIPSALKLQIDACQWFSDSLPFAYGNKSITHLGKAANLRMMTIGRNCGIDDCRPHRLRNTFAVRALTGHNGGKAMGVEDLSRLLGHSSVQITERYYSKWITARTRRLLGVMEETFDRPVKKKRTLRTMGKLKLATETEMVKKPKLQIA
jgi:integrase